MKGKICTRNSCVQFEIKLKEAKINPMSKPHCKISSGLNLVRKVYPYVITQGFLHTLSFSKCINSVLETVQYSTSEN